VGVGLENKLTQLTLSIFGTDDITAINAGIHPPNASFINKIVTETKVYFQAYPKQFRQAFSTRGLPTYSVRSSYTFG
jgi:hypothetical protein